MKHIFEMGTCINCKTAIYDLPLNEKPSKECPETDGCPGEMVVVDIYTKRPV